MAYKGNNTLNREERTVEFLKRDLAILAKGIEGKELYEINFDVVEEYLNHLHELMQDIRDGISARDHFVCYTTDSADIPNFFAKKNPNPADRTGLDERALNLLGKDFVGMLKYVDGKELNEIDLDGIDSYIDRLQEEVQDIKDGIRAPDHFMSYTQTQPKR